jgi:hypothetical protein
VTVFQGRAAVERGGRERDPHTRQELDPHTRVVYREPVEGVGAMPRCDGSGCEKRPVQQSAADENQAESARVPETVQAGTGASCQQRPDNDERHMLRKQQAVRRYLPGPVGRLR